MQDYMEILADSLNKKNVILDAILEQNALQAEAAAGEDFDMAGFERTVTEKEMLIAELTKLDNGFETVYERVRDELLKNRSRYAGQIAQMQEMIARIADKSMSVQASEARNKTLVEAAFRKTRKQLGQGRTSVKAASDYYKSMSRVNYIDPQMMDTKK